MAVQTAREVDEGHVLLSTDWKGYLKILSALGEHRGGTRVTYDRGSLEIVTTSYEHGRLADLLADLLREYMKESRIHYCGGGVETFKRKDLDRGTEPDNCFWIANFQCMIGVKRWNSRIHPPPDVMVEVTVTHGLISRLPIYAALGVPEAWWYDDGKIKILRLANGKYKTVRQSPTFPDLPAEVVARYLALSLEMSDFDVVDHFRQWLRER